MQFQLSLIFSLFFDPLLSLFLRSVSLYSFQSFILHLWRQYSRVLPLSFPTDSKFSLSFSPGYYLDLELFSCFLYSFSHSFFLFFCRILLLFSSIVYVYSPATSPPPFSPSLCPLFIRSFSTFISLYPSLRGFCSSLSPSIDSHCPSAICNSSVLSARIFRLFYTHDSTLSFIPFVHPIPLPSILPTAPRAISRSLHPSCSTAKVNPVSSEGAFFRHSTN